MPKPKEPKKNGRPRFKVDWEVVKNLCGEHFTQAEICRIIGTNANTLGEACEREHHKTFWEFYNEFKDASQHVISLRRMVWHKALKEQNGDMIKMLWKEYCSVKQNHPEVNITHISFSIDDIKNAISQDSFAAIPLVTSVEASNEK